MNQEWSKMPPTEPEDAESYQEWLMKASRNVSPLLETPTQELERKRAGWLSQEKIDQFPLGDGAGYGKHWKFWLYIDKMKFWIAIGATILAWGAVYIVYQGVKLLFQYWR